MSENEQTTTNVVMESKEPNLSQYIEIIEEHNEKHKDDGDTPPQYQLVKWMKELETIRNTISIPNRTKVLDLSHFAHIVKLALTELFGDWGCDTDHGDDFVFMYNETCTIDINKDGGAVYCVLAFNTKAVPNIVAEIVSIMKDIFTSNIVINPDLFVVDMVSNEYIWGEEAIKMYNQRLSGYKVSPIVVHDTDGMVGNC